MVKIVSEIKKGNMKVTLTAEGNIPEVVAKEINQTLKGLFPPTERTSKISRGRSFKKFLFKSL